MSDSTEYFNQTAADFASRYNRRTLFQRRLVIWQRYIESFAVTQGLCIDAGCGAGTLSELALAQGMQVIAFDPSSEMIALARQNFAGEENKIRFVVMKLPLEADSYDNKAHLVLCSSVLEYVAEIEPAIASLYKVLRPGGTLLISVPNRQSLFRKIEKLTSLFATNVRKYLQHQHHQFTLTDAKKVFEKAGFVYQAHEFFGIPSVFYKFKLPERSEFIGTMTLLVLTKN